MSLFTLFSEILEKIPLEDRKHESAYETVPFRDFKLKRDMQPIDQVYKNKDFFGALHAIGVHPWNAKVEKVYAPHNRRFHLLSKDLCMMGDRGPIVGFRVPELGAHHLHKRVLNDSYVVQQDCIVGRGNHVVVRGREKRDGVECPVFGVVYPDMTVYYMWDIDEIYRVDSNYPCSFERVGDEYYILSDVPKDFKTSIRYKVNPWESLSVGLLERCQEGVIVDCDAEQYKVPRVLTVTLEWKVNRWYDSHGQEIEVPIVEDREDGFYDVTREGEVVKTRRDRAYADSRHQIQTIWDCAVVVSDILGKIPLQREGINMDECDMTICSREDLPQIYNDKRVVPISRVFNKGENVSKRSGLIKQFFHSLQKKQSLEYPLFKAVHLNLLMWNNMMFVRDGTVHVLRYMQPKVYDEDGFSNVPKIGYGLIVLDEEDVPRHVRSYFYYRSGVYMVYYDYSKWRIKETYLLQWQIRSQK